MIPLNLHPDERELVCYCFGCSTGDIFQGTLSLLFKPGRRIAVKIIDARGVESLKIEKI